MARLFQASFERLTPAQLQSLGLWALVGSGIVSTTGRNGNGVTGTSGATQAQNTLRTVAFSTASADKGYQGFALKAVSLPAAERKVWALFDNAGAELVTVTVRPDGKVSSYAGSFETGSLLGTSSAAFVAAGSFRYLQVGYDFTANTLLVLSTNSGVTSLLASVPSLSSPLPWSFVEFYLDELLVLDDVYMNDSNTFIGPANNYFSGDTAVLDIGPVADVATGFGLEFFYPNTGSDKADVTDDAAFDSDATYVYSRDAYGYLLYQMETLADDGRTVDDVQVVTVSRAVSSTWAPEFGPYVRWWYGPTAFVGRAPLTWTGYRAQRVLLGRPGGNTWTIARVNDARFGVAC